MNLEITNQIFYQMLQDKRFYTVLPQICQEDIPLFQTTFNEAADFVLNNKTAVGPGCSTCLNLRNILGKAINRFGQKLAQLKDNPEQLQGLRDYLALCLRKTLGQVTVYYRDETDTPQWFKF